MKIIWTTNLKSPEKKDRDFFFGMLTCKLGEHWTVVFLVSSENMDMENDIFVDDVLYWTWLITFHINVCFPMVLHSWKTSIENATA